MSRIINVLLIAFFLSACQSVKNPVLVETVSPHIYCRGQLAWSAETVKDSVTEYSVFWIAFDAATVQDNFKYISVYVTLDGKPTFDEMKFRQLPEPYSVTCSEDGRQFEASRLKYTLFLPSLTKGEHKIKWVYRTTATFSDGLFDYPKGITGEVINMLSVY